MANPDKPWQFQVGNPGGPGRPPRRTEEERLVALSERVTPDKWAAVCDTALKQAISGDAKARDWLSEYLLPTLKVREAAALAALSAAGTETPDLSNLSPDQLRLIEGVLAEGRARGVALITYQQVPAGKPPADLG